MCVIKHCTVLFFFTLDELIYDKKIKVDHYSFTMNDFDFQSVRRDWNARWCWRATFGPSATPSRPTLMLEHLHAIWVSVVVAQVLVVRE